ncbi:hypothetical protein KY289_001504 [Solanum tuberosum]|nr:hypothetical protein KY289_001504 [Solanum tuberosum]
MYIAEKDKLSFVRGSTQPPTKKDEGYEKWYTDNQKVKRWLLISMSPEIMKRYIRLPIAQEIWKALSTAFYDGTDELQLDHRDKVIMESEKDVSSYRRSIQRQRVHIFLVGLDSEFEQIHGEILRKDPVPELEECYSMVRRESVRHATVNGDLEKSEATAMDIQNGGIITVIQEGEMQARVQMLQL